ncbi:MAG: DNA replication/repair protein RecF [Firmicutes bacterium]|nr:DNA replication/repair protein RecF [Bacillota bacterium]MDD4706696.1 DNA replication/repair protein RecF [Bacillota bacterium]
MDGLYLRELKLKNFRNYKEQALNPSRGFNLLLGNNAQGKTNLIEAIYLLSSGRSYRTPVDSELLRWGADTLYIKGAVVEEGGEKSIEIGIRGSNKRVKVNGVQLSKRGELFGKLTTVIFSPDELKLVKEGPNYRRKFMDQEIIQIKPAYYYVLTGYNKVLSQRNSLLKDSMKGRANIDTLEVWDKQLTEYGVRLIYDRQRFIKRLSGFAKQMHSKITNGQEDLEVTYQCCVGPKEEESLSDIRSRFGKRLQSFRGRDFKTGVTNFGPHREDLSVNVNGIDVRKYGSQGQQRTAALSMKLSEIELVKSETGEYPVLLLDDVMSELDLLRQEYILGNLARVQTFITCTHLTGVMKKRCDKGKVFNVNSGIITTEG